MSIRRLSVLTGAALALALVLATGALAAGTSVTVRIEGLKRTLLPATVVHTRAGEITKGGTPSGACPATSAAGALDVATKHRWNGSYGTYGLSVTSILGELHTFTKNGPYWSLWVNNRYAPAGVCALTLHRGEQLLFAAVSSQGSPYPMVLSAPAKDTVGQPFTVKVGYVAANGKTKPAGRATVKVGGSSVVATAGGTVTVTPTHTGRLAIAASKKGLIRSAAKTVAVS